jgi:hypothetical protein
VVVVVPPQPGAPINEELIEFPPERLLENRSCDLMCIFEGTLGWDL